MAKDLKRSLTIAGHRTSLSLEPEFWDALQKAASARGLSIATLVSEIDQTRGDASIRHSGATAATFADMLAQAALDHPAARSIAGLEGRARGTVGDLAVAEIGKVSGIAKTAITGIRASLSRLPLDFWRRSSRANTVAKTIRKSASGIPPSQTQRLIDVSVCAETSRAQGNPP